MVEIVIERLEIDEESRKWIEVMDEWTRQIALCWHPKAFYIGFGLLGSALSDNVKRSIDAELERQRQEIIKNA
mgnify:CR=1 FL=1